MRAASAIPVASSAIDRIAYDEAARTLVVTFRSGAVYRYRGVPPGVFQAFLSSGSKGRFFMEEVRDRYVTERAA